MVEDYKFGFYSADARFCDEILYAAPYHTVVRAAGNDRQNNSCPWQNARWFDPALQLWVWIPSGMFPPNDGSFETLIPEATAKNAITVGAVVEDPLLLMTEFSSWGPTDDGRIKPDVVSCGTEVYSAITYSLDLYPPGHPCHGEEWCWADGTSTAAASVSGSVNLLVQYYKSTHGGPPRSATIKALIVNTANRPNGDHSPDYRWGWGVMDTEAAAQLIHQDQADPSVIQQVSLHEGEVHDFSVYSDGTEPLLITIAWTDPPGPTLAPEVDPPTAILVNDLDMRLERMSDAQIFQPFVLNPASPHEAATTGDNFRDNVEKIAIVDPQPGYYRITVTHKGSLYVHEPQPYSLVYSGASYPGVVFDNKSGETGELATSNFGAPYSVVAADFFDADGRQDLFVSLKSEPGMMFQCNRINANGVPEFSNVTVAAFHGALPAPGCRGASVADYDNDGDRDLFVAHATQPRLYRNNGNGTFTDVAGSVGLLAHAQDSWTGAWGDYDRDGRVDLFVGRWGYSGQDPDPAHGGQSQFNLLRNATAETGGFVLANQAAGLTDDPQAACIAATWTDVNGDGLSDLFVGNLTGAARLYVNHGWDDEPQSYRFENETSARIFHPLLKVCGLTWFDHHGDGDFDLAAARMETDLNNVALYCNNAGALDWAYGPALHLVLTGKTNGVMSLDCDLNGREDLLLVPHQPGQAVALFANSPPGGVGGFTDLGAQCGIDFGTGHGVVLHDFNADGDPDALLGRPAADQTFFYRNVNSIAPDVDPVPKHSLRVRLVGNGCDNNRDGIGARVTFSFDAPGDAPDILQVQMVDGGSGQGGQKARELHFATGNWGDAVQVTVKWPSGYEQTQSLASVLGGATYTISEPGYGPAIDARSVTAWYIAEPAEQATWKFKWRTTEWTNPDLDRVVVRDVQGTPPQCEVGTLEFKPSQYGVSAALEPATPPQVGYWHTLTVEGMPCTAVCSYKYDVFSTHACQEAQVLNKQFTVSACLE